MRAGLARVIALLQRVSSAAVHIDGDGVGAIEQGILALIGVEREDDSAKGRRLLERVLTYRIFSDESGRMNRSLRDIQGGLLLVPQFTLVADTRKGTRPGFSRGASPEHGQTCFAMLLAAARERHPSVESGQFGADMQVSLVNDGPVTFWLQV